MRLDKFLSETTMESRSQVKKEIRQGMVTVNGIVEKLPEKQIEEKTDCVCLKGKELHYQPFVYFMLNKPAGVVSATEDTLSKTVVELLSREDYRKDIFPAGRLDKDTEGFLLLTNDGAFANALMHPKHEVEKTYDVWVTGYTPGGERRLAKPITLRLHHPLAEGEAAEGGGAVGKIPCDHPRRPQPAGAADVRCSRNALHPAAPHSGGKSPFGRSPAGEMALFDGGGGCRIGADTGNIRHYLKYSCIFCGCLLQNAADFASII